MCLLAVRWSTGVSVLVPVLMLQMFAAASGFDVPARRGHFDLLLTGGRGRLHIVSMHAAMSALPGLVAWVALGLSELLVAQTASAFASGTVAAFWIVSTLAWAMTVRLPRLSGGVVWLMLAALAFAPFGGDRSGLLAALGGKGPPILRMGAVLVCPFALVGVQLDGADALAALGALAISTCAWAIAAWHVVREDIPLETAQ